MSSIMRSLSFMVACVLLACASPAHAAGNFWLSSSSVAGAPGLLDLSGAPGSTGTMYLWGRSDVGVAGFGFNVASSGPGLAFASATYSADATNASAWNLGNKPIVVTPAKVSDITAATLAANGGFGPVTVIGQNMLIASLSYTLGAQGSTSNLSLQVNDFGVADNQGNPLSFRFGDPNSPLITGEQYGVSGLAGSATVVSGPDTSVNIVEVIVNDRALSAGPISRQLDDGPAVPPVTWSNLVLNSGSPANAPTLSPTGIFTWDPAGSTAGPKGNGVLYRWTATAANSISADTDFAISIRLIIPEPGTMWLVGMAIMGATCPCRISRQHNGVCRGERQ